MKLAEFKKYRTEDMTWLFTQALKEEVPPELLVYRLPNTSKMELPELTPEEVSEVKQIMRDNPLGTHRDFVYVEEVIHVKNPYKYLYDRYVGCSALTVIGTEPKEMAQLAWVFETLMPGRVRCFIIPYTKWEVAGRPTSWYKFKCCYRPVPVR